MTKADQSEAQSDPPLLGGAARFFCSVFGVVLPWTALAVEMTTGICRDGFFDPLPTYWHAGAVALVGAINLLGLIAMTRRPPSREYLQRAGVLNGVVLGVAAYFSLWFIPLMPFALIGILAFGLGLLPLSPALSVIVGLTLHRAAKRQARHAGWTTRRAWPWALAAAVGMMAFEMPRVIEDWAVKTIADREEGRQEAALRVLRSVGDDDQLLRDCYEHRSRRGHPFNLRSWLGNDATLENYREAYFRVTGRPYNHRPPPDGTLSGSEQLRAGREWVWDEGLGGEAVSARMKALYLTESRLDGRIEADAALGYLEWTMVFRNDHEFQQREARALVQLPAGAVVSRLTLWIDGEEREAAFGGRSQVRQAYQAVVNQRRDPVLVTAKGPDRVLVQCFPVEPGGKEMKIRLGITLPLIPEGMDTARFALPRVLEQNFSAARGLSHAVWIESSRELTSGQKAYRAETPRKDRHVLRGDFSAAQFGSFSSAISVRRDPSSVNFWTVNPMDEQSVVTQKLLHQAPAGGPLFIVLDGSGETGPVASIMAEALENLPASFSVGFFLAGDIVQTCPSMEPRAVAAWLRERKFVGGQDATAALQAAVNGLGIQGGTVLWIHGAQPVTWLNTAALEQSLTRRSGRVRLLALSALPGPNVLLEKLDEPADLTVLPRLGNFREDLLAALDRLQNGTVVVLRGLAGAEGKQGTEASSHLARLWAAGEIARMLSVGQENRDAAVALAVRMQLVTALSGAVVLETQQQYDAAGLEPVNPGTTPKMVPDGGSTLLMLAASLSLLHLLTSRRISAQKIMKFSSASTCRG
jgi:hypothetical protein